MKYLFLIILALALYAIFIFVRIYYFARFSGNPPISQTQLQIGQGSKLVYVAAGDSTAVGIGSSSVEQSYPQRLARALSTNHTVEYHNIAVSGAQSKDIINSQLKQIISLNPDVVTISVGGNDATHLVSQKTLLSNYQTIIQELTDKTSAQIYISDIPNFRGAVLLPAWFIWLIEFRSSYINPNILKLATDRVHIINIHDFGHKDYPDIAATYSFDHFHPNDLGYTNWFNAFWTQIEPNFSPNNNQ